MSTIDLPALQAQLASLERQKNLLTTKLLTLRATHPLSTTIPTPTSSTPNATPQTTTTTTTTTTTPQPPPPLTDDQILSQIFTSSSAHQTTTLTRLHRSTGITTFTVADPSPPHTKLLGIRIEIFSDRKFLTPHYLLLSFPPESSKPSSTFTIHRHTIPTYIPLTRLTRTHARSLPEFVRSLRRTLLLHARRVAAVGRLKTCALGAGRVGDVMEEWTNRVEGVEWDAEVALVVVTWGNGSKGWIRVGEDGKVGKVVVKDAKGRRNGDVERRITGGLEEVAGRMGWEGERV